MKRKTPPSPPANSFLLITLVACTALLTTFKIKTFTLWGGLLNGTLWWQHPSLKMIDQVTFTQTGLPYDNPAWLGEVIFAGIYALGGLTGIIVFKSLILMLMIGLLWRHMRGRGANAQIIFWIGLITIFLGHYQFTVGPQIFSYLFLMYLSTQLYAFKISNKLRLWHIIPLMTIWTNLHFGSIFGLILLGTYFLAALLARQLPYLFDNNLKNVVDGPMLKHLGVVFLLSILACLINPAGLGFLTFPLETAYLALKYRVIDFYPPRSFPYSWLPLFWCTLAFYVVVIFGMIRRLDVFDMLIFLVAAMLGLKMVHLIPVFAILTAPIIIHYLAILAEKPIWPTKLSHILGHRLLTAGIALGLVCVFIVAKGGPRSSYQFGYGANRALLPFGVVNFLKTNKIQGNILSDVDWGGFLAQQLYPSNKVFMQNRVSAMGDPFFEIYFDLISGRPGWDATLSSYQVDVVVLSQWLAGRAPLTVVLTASPAWHLVYKDEQALVYIREKPEFRDFIDIFKYRAYIEQKPQKGSDL